MANLRSYFGPVKPKAKALSHLTPQGPPYPDLLAKGPIHDRPIDDPEKVAQLTILWGNAHLYSFPEKKLNGKMRKLSDKWLKDCTWLRYSVSQDALYCAPCVLFGKESKEKTFQANPVTDWSNLAGYVKRHLRPESSHHTYALMAENFVDIQHGKKEPISNMVSDSRRTTIQNNRNILKQIIETLILCGRQNIAIRGQIEERSNFFALLHFKAQDNADLAVHLGSGASPRAKYTSPDVQNELLSLCGSQLTEDTLRACSEASCFALLADECTDKATKEQISVCLRFVDKQSHVREEFLDFVEATTTKGVDIAKSLLDNLRGHGIDIQKMRAQGYDGAANMSGKIKGVQTRLREIVLEATYVHCKAHCLNLAVVQASNIPAVRTMMGTVQDVAFSFDYSAKRLQAFHDELARDQTSQQNLDGRTKLRTLCETRWTSRADALSTLKSAYSTVVHCLEHLQETGDDKAGMRLAAVTRFDFIVALVVAEHVLQNTVNLSYLLQAKDCDVLEAITESKVVIQQLQDERTDGAVWDALYETAIQLGNAIGVDPSMPRVANRQANRANPPAENASEYWHMSLYLPFMDHLNTQLTDRLLNAEERFIAGCLLPTKLDECTAEVTRRIFNEYSRDLPQGYDDFVAEVNRWKTRWSMTEEKPATLGATLERSNPVLYPLITRVLTVMLTMPPSTASVERTFSVMKRLKTYLRATMLTDRMSNLAKLHIYREKVINVDAIVDRFAEDKSRRIAFK